MIKFLLQKSYLGLAAIIVISFVIGLFGLTHGLPLHTVGDEESVATGVFKMLELKTIIPAQYPEEFRPFYYPPIMAYLIIGLSLPVIFFKFITLGFSVTNLMDYFALNQDLIWISARLLVLIFSALTLIVIYNLGKEIYNRNVGLIAAALLSTSFFFNNLQHWIRHWVFATFFAYLTFLLVYKYYNQTLKNKFIPAIVASLAIGTSYVTSIGLMITGLYALIQRKKINDFPKFLVVSVAIGLIFGGGLAAMNYPVLINLFTPVDGTLQQPKSFVDLANMLGQFFSVLLHQEVVITILALAGLIFVGKFRKANWSILSAVAAYSILLYVIFHFEIRYVYFAIPAVTLIAASFVYNIISNINSRGIKILILILFFTWPVATSLRYQYLVVKQDTRIQAIHYIEDNFANQEFILDSDKIKLSRTVESLELAKEQGRLSAAERHYLNNNDRIDVGQQFSYQNLHFWDDLSYLDDYFSEHDPKYLVVEYWSTSEISTSTVELMKSSDLVQRFRQSDLGNNYDINGNFYASNKILFALDRLGPTVDIYQLEK